MMATHNVFNLFGFLLRTFFKMVGLKFKKIKIVLAEPGEGLLKQGTVFYKKIYRRKKDPRYCEGNPWVKT